MKLFEIEEDTWYRTTIRIFGIKFSKKHKRPTQMNMPQRIKALKKLFFTKTGSLLDLNNPQTFNEKINWMKLFYHNDEMTRIVDKYEFKNYIKEKLGDGYTVPLLGAWDNVNDIDFSKLPKKFVLKCNAQSDSISINIVHNKDNLDINQLKTEMQDWLNPRITLKTSYCGAYHNVPLKIIAEEYIEQIDGQVYDYKFMCFNGEPMFVLACSDRGQNTIYENYDMNWNLFVPSPNSAKKATIPCPKNFDKMIDIAKKLSAPFPFVRVDFYEIEDKILLGEMTFYPNGGFNTYYPEWNKRFGDYINLPEIENKPSKPLFFEKVKDKNRRIFKICGKKVFSYHKSLSRKELTRRLEYAEDKLKKLSYENFYNNKKFNYLNQNNMDDKYKEKLIEERFYKEVGYYPNLKNPETFNEKINWLKLYYKNDTITECVDKYRFKNYIKNQLGDGYTVPLLGVWDNANDIDIGNLPNKFVLKVNWSSYQNFIVKDKNTFDFDSAKIKINNWMSPWQNVYFSSFYYGYKNVTPKVIAEKYIEQPDGKLNDYKFYCFNGIPKYLYVIDEGFSKNRPLCWDVDNNHMFKITEGKIELKEKQPQNMDTMLELALKLAKPFPFVRVDFYETGDKVYVGKLTFYPGNGFNKFIPKELDRELGELLDLSVIQ